MNSSGISVVIGVLNENENIDPLLERFDDLIRIENLKQINEIVFVDDGSNDGTVEKIKNHKSKGHHFSINLVSRKRKFGLVNAHITGCKAASNDDVIVMDGDLQHPVNLIAPMVKQWNNGCDAVIASRYVPGGGNSWKPIRGIVSRGAIAISHFMIPSTRSVKDTMSGYFLTKRKYIVGLAPFEGVYKLLLYTLSMNPDLRTVEVPFIMVDREVGDSKIVNKSFKFFLVYLTEVLKYMKERRNLAKKKYSGDAAASYSQ